MAVVLPTLLNHASPNFSSRRGARVHLVVAHRPVGSYQGSIDFLCEPTVWNPDGTVKSGPGASAHVITKPGGMEATQLVGWDSKAWACEAFNSFSDNIEFNDEMWVGKDPHGLAVAARIVAFRCHVRGIPPVWTKQPHTSPGVCRHYDLGIAGGGHTDPTEDTAIWHHFMDMVRAEAARGGFRPEWGSE